MRKIAVLINIMSCVTILLSGCVGPGIADYSYTVGTGYELMRTSGHQISVAPIGGNDGTKPEINPKVVEIAWDDRYVIAKRIGLKSAYPNNPDNSYEIPDENDISYWILDTEENILMGGYKLDEFEEQLKRLGIYTKLKLRSVESYLED